MRADIANFREISQNRHRNVTLRCSELTERLLPFFRSGLAQQIAQEVEEGGDDSAEENVVVIPEPG